LHLTAGLIWGLSQSQLADATNRGSTEKRFKCYHCKKDFRSISDRNRHILSVHIVKRPRGNDIRKMKEIEVFSTSASNKMKYGAEREAKAPEKQSFSLFDKALKGEVMEDEEPGPSSAFS
ncbi:hypothetical protein PMAYCL1PPCAC_05018, partial [Pristionchus mayeri]